jgi:hypothetical protein
MWNITSKRHRHFHGVLPDKHRDDFTLLFLDNEIIGSGRFHFQGMSFEIIQN